MRKATARKGFTTVELVIVIAVIAILATVLIPTFSNLISKAQESAAIQECKGCLEVMLHDNLGELKGGTWYFVYNKNPGQSEDVWYIYENQTLVKYTGTKPTIAAEDKIWATGEAVKILQLPEGVSITPTKMSDLSPHVEVLCDATP